MTDQSIRDRLRALDVGSELPRLLLLQGERKQLEQEIVSTSARIGTLDRLNIFTDSPEEARVKHLRQQIEIREADYVRIGSQWNQALATLETDFASFSIVRNIERLLSPCLEFVFANGANPAAAVASLKNQLFKLYCGDNSLADLLTALAEPQTLPLSMAEPVADEQLGWQVAHGEFLLGILSVPLRQAADYQGWRVDAQESALTEPLALLCQYLGHYPPLRCVLALAQLEVLLRQSTAVTEVRLDKDGRLQPQTALPLGASLLDNLEQLLQVTRETFPGVPFGQEVRSWFLPVEVHEVVGIGAPSQWLELRPLLTHRCMAVVALECLAEQAKSAVSWVDRVNVFTQSASEEREKLLRTALDTARKRLQEMAAEHQAGPGQQVDAHNLAGTVAQHCVGIFRAVEKVSTNPGSSSWKMNCILKNQQVLAERLDSFRSWLRDSYELPFTLNQLIGQIEQASPARGNLAGLLCAKLASTTFLDLLREARKQRQVALRAFQQRGQARAEVSVFDRLNIFSESDSEKAEKQSKAEWVAAHTSARDSEDRLEWTLMQALSQHPQAHLYYASEELSIQVPSLCAVCRSRTTRHTSGSGDNRRTTTRTTYYCEVSGLESVRQLTRDLTALAHSCGCHSSGAWTRLTQRRLSWIEDPVLRAALPEGAVESDAAGLKPGQVQVKAGEQGFAGGQLFEDYYLDWCQQHELGPASQGRF